MTRACPGMNYVLTMQTDVDDDWCQSILNHKISWLDFVDRKCDLLISYLEQLSICEYFKSKVSVKRIKNGKRNIML